MRSFSLSVGQTLHVIRVLVRDENPGQVFRRPANGSEALANLTQAEARVNQDAGLVGFHVGAVAGGTAAEDGQANRHSCYVTGVENAGQRFN